MGVSVRSTPPGFRREWDSAFDAIFQSGFISFAPSVVSRRQAPACPRSSSTTSALSAVRCPTPQPLRQPASKPIKTTESLINMSCHSPEGAVVLGVAKHKRVDLGEAGFLKMRRRVGVANNRLRTAKATSEIHFIHVRLGSTVDTKHIFLRVVLKPGV